MREILFRGKRTDTGEWVKGDLISNLIYDGREKEKRIGHIYFETGEEIHGTEVYNVIPETVGQYTGLTDRNGKKIFEGDIVEGHCHSQWSHRLQRCVIEYDREGFEARHYVEQGGVMRYYSYKVLFSKDVVVIGNIHDNPELLN